jgi:EAL domain-containing protein (putative c-di-GMP-specific phosphodiesterase class I)
MTKVLETIAAEIRGLFPGTRLRSLSIHDTEGEAVWMSDGVLGPDEHALALDALDLFQLEAARRCFDRSHGDGDIGMSFPLREPIGDLRGVLVIVADSRTFSGSPQEKALQQGFQAILRRLAVLLRPAATEDADRDIVSTSAAGAASDYPPSPIDPRFATLSLYVQQMLRLRTNGRTRRYEVLLRNRTGGGEQRVPADLLEEADAPDSRGTLDMFVIGQLVKWFAENRQVLEAEPASFSVNISLGALANPGFLEGVSRLLHKAEVNPRMLAFELREQVCRERSGDVQRFVQQCEELKCQVVIDDFTMNSEVLPLLRSPAVRLVKIDAGLTGAALSDKLSQAVVVAISQAAKVLGAHCVAKRIESTIARQWLAAIGVDFAQGFLLEGLMPLTALSAVARDDRGTKAS